MSKYYYRESQSTGKWIPMSKKEIMEYCDIQIQNYNILKEDNKKLKEENEKIGELVISQTHKLRDVSIKHNDLVVDKNAYLQLGLSLQEENKKLKDWANEIISFISLSEIENLEEKGLMVRKGCGGYPNFDFKQSQES